MQSGQESLEELARRVAGLLEERAKLLERVEESVVEVRARDLDEILNKYKVIFLYFTASWCGPCISFLQTFREVAGRHVSPNVFYGYVDVDASYSVADRYNVKHIPSIVVIIDGKPVDVIIGSMSREKLESRVRGYLKAAGLAS